MACQQNSIVKFHKLKKFTMISLTRILDQNWRNISRINQLRAYGTETVTGNVKEEEFRVLNLRTIQHRQKRREFKKQDVPPPRTMKMSTNQDWTAVWPGPRSFHPAAVPLPVRQGFTDKGAAPPFKYANAELIKIPNFLHLTPPAIKQQCEALKKFCTLWPKGLETEDKWKTYFPVDVISTDYCHALPTIRNPEARKVTLKFKLSQLQFDAHAKDKFLRLIGNRHNRETDIVTITADRCPLRKQNYDYAMYLVTACYHESFVSELWESTKQEVDMECYKYEHNKSKESVESILNWGKESKEGTKVQATEDFVKNLEQLINDGENDYNLNKYKEEVITMLGLHKNN